MNQTISTSGGRTVALRLEPLDVLFFRDGRPFTEGSRGQSGLPVSQTLAGAVRTYLLREAGCQVREFEELSQRLRGGASLEEAINRVCGAGWIARVEVRGPWFCRDTEKGFEVLVPLPVNLHRLKAGNGSETTGKNRGSLIRLDPLRPDQELPGWDPPLPGMRPLWLKERVRTEFTMHYLQPAGLKAYLAGETPEEGSLVKAGELYDFDYRTGIGIEPDQLTSEEGLIYAISLLSLRRGVGLYAEVRLPTDSPDGLFSQESLLDFGGEGRKVLARPVEQFTWPTVSARDGRVLLLLTTPAVFENVWCPKFSNGTSLVAAAVGGYQAFSGWDLARGGPKPTRFAVPAGSVYFVETSQGESLGDSLADSEEDRRLGYGCIVQGVWNYV